MALFAHFVWGTWDRLPLLIGETRRQVYRSIQATCVELGVEVIALGGVEDYIHPLKRLPATVAPAELMKCVKGASAHLATPVIAPDRFFKWQGAYAAFSVGRGELDHLCASIARQDEHHRLGSLIPEWEEEPDDSTDSGDFGSWSAQADFVAARRPPPRRDFNRLLPSAHLARFLRRWLYKTTESQYNDAQGRQVAMRGWQCAVASCDRVLWEG